MKAELSRTITLSLTLFLIAQVRATRTTYVVTLVPNISSIATQQLWRDYDLAQDEPRYFFRHPGNFLVVMNDKKQKQLSADSRVEYIAQFAWQGSAQQQGNAIKLHDAALRRICQSDDGTLIPERVPCALSNESVTIITLRVVTSKVFDSSAGSAVEVAREVQKRKWSSDDKSENDSCAYEFRVQENEQENRVFLVNIDERYLCRGIEVLLSVDGVVEVEHAEKAVQLNNYAAATGQSGSKSKISQTNAVIWNEGIMGQGEIVVIGDSGVDLDSCFFREDRFSAPVLSGCDLSRRKIVCYYETVGSSFGDDSVALGGGHGTHVAATVAGLHAHILTAQSSDNLTAANLLKDADYPNGMAPLAKLAIFDINGENPGELMPPEDFASTDFFIKPYEDVGARIHTNSWGCAKYQGHDRECNTYQSQTRSMDEFMWRNKDFLVIVAAGNAGALDIADGNVYKDGFYTVGAPSTNKNGISVGATRRNNRTPFECVTNNRECSVDDLYVSSSRGPTFDGRIKPDLVFPGEKTWSAASSGDPQDFSEGTDCANASLAIGMKTLSGTSMSCPGIAGLAALVRQYFREIDPHSGTRNISNSPLRDRRGPSAALVKATLINSARTLTGVYSFRPGIGKPLQMEYVQNAPNPRHVEGFGLPALNNTLLFDTSLKSTSDDTSRKSLWIMDRYAFVDGSESHVFTLRVVAKASLKCTLVYTDPPGPLTPAFDRQPVLVNDLDLEIEFECLVKDGYNTSIPDATSNTRVRCPEKLQDNGTWTSASRVDNVEQVPTLTNEPWTFAESVIAKVRVKAQKISIGPQPYALVISGFGISRAIDGEWAAPNWSPDWTATANIPQSLHVAQRKVLTGGLAAAGVLAGLFALTIVCGCASSARKRRRSNEQQEGMNVGHPNSMSTDVRS